ncbi:Ras GTPase activating protein ira2 [Rhizopus azygosporus]|uniref:Ras GTPase activating protein ira2 n=2 Tax=Rhizopus TaxID=4842 RepID=A0A367JI78_RHIAZ|nr:Ras GTPase activating protein ira2 [Rhizopus azygosporus]
MSTYLAPLKESTILAMSNLLSANVDAGLKYSLSMGYHDDPQMRTAFMKVLTNILNQGTEFETLAETVMTDRYEKVVDMFVSMDLNIALSLCDVCPASDIEDAANALLACFASRGKTLDLLKAVIRKEVENTDSETELLRRTSIATRLLSVFARHNGADYVRSVLQPVFTKLAEKPPEEKTFELDSSKVGSGEDVSRNKQNVINATEMFLNAICESANEAPRSFREVCHCILTSVRERYPEAMYTAVGAFIFLRFFCPAIVSPESEGLIKINTVISREMKRGHLIATKVIQNLANNVLFGAKETYMIVLNDFLTNNIYKVTNFLREISEVPPPTTTVLPDGRTIVEDVRPEVRPMEQKDYNCLHRVLFDNMERISREIAARRIRQHLDPERAAAYKQGFDKFSNLMAQLGRPPEATKPEFSGLRSYTFAAANQLYAEFMRRNSHRSVEPIVSKNIFYEGGVSKANRPVFYYISRHVLADSIDFELLTYHILQTLERASNKNFELVFDCTLFSQANEIPNQYIIQLVQLLPFDACDNIANIVFYNPNSHLRKFMKKFPRPISHKLAKRFNFAVTLAEIYDYISPNELRLPKTTTSLDTDQCHVFHPASRMTQNKLNIPVTIKVSAEYVQAMTVRKQEFIYNVTTVLNDVYMISDIEDITIVPNSRSQEIVNEFHFKYNKGKTQHVFTSMKRDAIVNHIRHNKRRLEMTKPNNISERTIRPNDVPGRLLNMALLNIGSDDPNLRLAAYNLLCALSMTFHFDLNNQLLDAKDLCLPANSTAFVVAISERIAENQPNLTLEFLSECFIGFQKSSEPLRYLCLDYMVPWLPNLSRFCHSNIEDKETVKTKEVLRNLIDLTVARTEMYKLIQAKIWKTIGQIDDILNLVLDSFVQFSIEHGVGSSQAEAMADTFVTLSNIAVRGKVISRLRKVLQKTSFKPTRTLTDHWTWNEIAILIRFVLMLSFNNRGPVKSYVPEIFHIVSLIVGVGPTLIRASIHGLIVNMIQSLCTCMPLQEANIKKLQLILNEISDTKYRLLFGLFKPHANAFTITPETLTDAAEPISLHALETIVSNLLEVIAYSAPSQDMANAWRARWMSLVASTAFQFNPAIQPQAFVVLGCLGREETDDDLLYQILVALRGALAIFNEADPNLVLSIMMCLKNIVESLPPDSRYLLALFWVAVALVEINNGPIFTMAIELILAVLRALDTAGYFTGESVVEVLLSAREPMANVSRKLDQLCGVNFESHFSFAIASIFLKGLRYNNGKEIVFQGLATFLDIECKHSDSTNMIDPHHLGYLAGILPLAAKNETLKEVLRLTGLLDPSFELDDEDEEDNLEAYAYSYSCIFDRLDVTDETTALLFVSMLVAQLQVTDSNNEKLFLYHLLAEAASSMPAVFSTVYDSLLPKMNQVVLNSTNQSIIESVKSILLTACSDPSFSDASRKNHPTQRSLLESVGFPALADPSLGASSANVLQNAKLASEIIELIIA